MMTRRSTLDAVGGFNEEFELGEDLELLFRMRRLGVNIIVSDEVWTHRRILGDNLSYDVEATQRVLFRAIQANRPHPGDTEPEVPSS